MSETSSDDRSWPRGHRVLIRVGLTYLVAIGSFIAALVVSSWQVAGAGMAAHFVLGGLFAEEMAAFGEWYHDNLGFYRFPARSGFLWFYRLAGIAAIPWYWWYLSSLP